jgi:hypothetical protein
MTLGHTSYLFLSTLGNMRYGILSLNYIATMTLGNTSHLFLSLNYSYYVGFIGVAYPKAKEIVLFLDSV